MGRIIPRPELRAVPTLEHESAEKIEDGLTSSASGPASTRNAAYAAHCLVCELASAICHEAVAHQQSLCAIHGGVDYILMPGFHGYSESIQMRSAYPQLPQSAPAKDPLQAVFDEGHTCLSLGPPSLVVLLFCLATTVSATGKRRKGGRPDKDARTIADSHLRFIDRCVRREWLRLRSRQQLRSATVPSDNGYAQQMKREMAVA